MSAVRRDLFNEATPHERDLLDHGPLVEELADILQTERTPLTVMINGSWGSGKTSFLRSLARHIQTCNVAGRHSRRCATVWFDPWEHEDAPNIIVPFLNRLRQEAYHDDEERRQAYSDKEKSLLAELLWMLIPDEIQHLVPGGTMQPHSLRQRMRGLIRMRRRHLETLVDRAVPFHGKPREQLSVRVRRQFVEYVKAIQARGFDRVVILLDDLDRCQPQVMRKLLELVKVNLLGAAGPDRVLMAGLEVVFIFAIDHQTLTQAVSEPESPTPTADYARYLDKIFDLRISLPRVVPGDVKRLLEGLIGSRHPDVKQHLNRRLEGGTPAGPNSYQEILGDIVSRYQELRTARFLRRIVNKLMIFAYVEDAESGLIRDGVISVARDHRFWRAITEKQVAAHLVIAWHVFGQAWLTTQSAVLRGDGLGLLQVLRLGQISQRPETMLMASKALHHQHISPAGVVFLREEILRRIKGGTDLLDALEEPARSAPLTRTHPGPSTPGPPAQQNAPALLSLDPYVAMVDAALDDLGDPPPGQTQSDQLAQRVSPSRPHDIIHTARTITNYLMRLDDHVRRNLR